MMKAWMLHSAILREGRKAKIQQQRDDFLGKGILQLERCH